MVELAVCPELDVVMDGADEGLWAVQREKAEERERGEDKAR